MPEVAAPLLCDKACSTSWCQWCRWYEWSRRGLGAALTAVWIVSGCACPRLRCARRARVAQVDPETEDPFAPDGGLLGAVPLSKDGTFMRTIPEFKYWYRLTKAFAVAFSLTFFELFNVPVSRPILVMYFVLLFFQARTRRLRPALAPRHPHGPALLPHGPGPPCSQAGKRQIEHMIRQALSTPARRAAQQRHLVPCLLQYPTVRRATSLSSPTTRLRPVRRYQYMPCSFGKKSSPGGAKTVAV